jgi:hypothetical protein
VDNLPGAISERKTAIPILTGTPIDIAIAAVTKVPMMYGSAPKASLPYTAFQSVLVKNSMPSYEKISIEPSPTA